MSLGKKNKPICEGWVTEESADAGNDVSEEEVVGLPTKMDFLLTRTGYPAFLCSKDV